MFIKRARRSMLDYFVSHRSMPWWLSGHGHGGDHVSADTPLAVTEWSSRYGVAGTAVRDGDLRNILYGFLLR